MISAQIKKGNIFLIDSLEDHMLQLLTLPQNRNYKPLKLTYYNFIQTITQISNQFVRSKNPITFNLHIIDHYVRKYESGGDLYRYFFGFTQIWKRSVEAHEDAKLFLSLLCEERNDRESIRAFLKIRKIILKNINMKIMEQISVTHSDALTICHMLFSGENRSKVIKKINNLFISLKRKLVNTAKVNGAVACQFFLGAAEELEHQNYPLQLRNDNDNDNRHAVVGKERQRAKVGRNKGDQLSFSQEYADYYEKERQPLQADSIGEEFQSHSQQKDLKKQKQNALLYKETQNIEQEWGNKKGILNLDNAKKSLNQLSRKDRVIDAKLQGTGLIEWKNYPEGWDEFIRKNQLQKEKLLHGGGKA